MTVTTERAAGRSLITPVLFDRLTQRITTDHPDITQADAERILDQALAFLATCATSTIPLGPSDIVDIGWHTFLLYTGEYADFCTKVAGRYIHHAPDDLPGPRSRVPRRPPPSPPSAPPDTGSNPTCGPARPRTGATAASATPVATTARRPASRYARRCVRPLS